VYYKLYAVFHKNEEGDIILVVISLSNLHRFSQVFHWLMHFLRLLAVCWLSAQSTGNNHSVACNLAKYSPIKKIFTYRLSNKPLLIWLLTIPFPPHLKYVAKLPCNLSSMAVLLTLMFHKVATYARCGGSFNIHLTTNLPRNLPVKFLLNRSRFDKIMVMSLWSHFFGPPCIVCNVLSKLSRRK